MKPSANKLPVLSSGVFLQHSQFDTERIKKELTLQYKALGEEVATPIPTYWEDKDGILVPRQWGLQYLKTNKLEYTDATTSGMEITFQAKVPPRNKAQENFIEEIVSLFEAGEYDCVGKAPTGQGKTYMAIEIARRLGRNFLVVVDQENLLTQWVERATQLFNLTEDEIGVVRGARCDYEGKKMVIGMVQSLSQKRYPEGLYQSFGLVVYDESHTVGSQVFSRAILQFPSKRKLAVSATPHRRDEFKKTLEWNLGHVKVSANIEHRGSSVYYLESDTVYSWYANTSPKAGRYITEIAEDGARNLKLARAIKWLYESGRDTLVVSDRIDQLEALMALCYYMGVPVEDMGQYTGYRNLWKWQKDEEPKRRPKEWERGTEYTPVKFHEAEKTNPSKRLAEVLAGKKILFASFSMFTKGVDCPRLAAGIDCTPRSQAVQVQGRILRAQAGKLTPIWVTVMDTKSFRSLHQFAQRLGEYEQSNAEVFLWNPEKGVKKQDLHELRNRCRGRVNDLRPLKIVQALDGRNVLTEEVVELRQERPTRAPNFEKRNLR